MKDPLRRHFLNLLQSLPPKRRLEASQKLCAALEDFCAPFQRIASFSSMQCEIDLTSFNLKIAKSGRLLLPKRDGLSLEYFQVDAEHLPKKASGTLFEPNPDLYPLTGLTDKDLLLVPGLAFDQDHYRLGFGKGHFDRFLVNHPLVLTVGIGFCEQKSSELLPRDPWDIPLQKLFLF